MAKKNKRKTKETAQSSGTPFISVALALWPSCVPRMRLSAMICLPTSRRSAGSTAPSTATMFGTGSRPPQTRKIEAAFKNLKDDLALRPIFHQLERRIEAHIFVAFMAYCLHVTLRARLRPLAPGLTPRAVLDKFAAIQMLDVHFPTTDGRTLILSRYTHPEPEALRTSKSLSRT
jgi:hypothetical protein